MRFVKRFVPKRLLSALVNMVIFCHGYGFTKERTYDEIYSSISGADSNPKVPYYVAGLFPTDPNLVGWFNITKEVCRAYV